MTQKTSTTEYETKVVDFDLQDVLRKLSVLGAKETSEILLKRWVFDFSGKTEATWLRLRSVGEKSYLAFKKKPKRNTVVGVTKEIEVEVQDFEKMYQILSKVPFDKLFYQENKRHRFELDGIEFCIDTWPNLPPYLEIESDSEEKLKEGLKMLGLEGKDIGDKDVKVIYEEAGIDLHSFSELKFN